jgi:hypothetical protein
MELIGFAENSLKQAAANAVLQKNWRDTKSADYATVISVEDLKIVEEVYNITVDHPLHQFAVNGIISANCGEQWLGPYENCCLGSVNLNEHCGPDGKVDWELLRQSTVLATRFLDDVVEANAYVPAVPQLSEAAHRARRIGLGVSRGCALWLEGGSGVWRTGDGIRPLSRHADQYRTCQGARCVPGDRRFHLRSKEYDLDSAQSVGQLPA